MSPSEEKNMGGYVWKGQCNHLCETGCSIYEKRALVCRLFGTSEIFQCENCKPERYLSEDETLEIIHEYTKYRNKELNMYEKE